MKPQLIHKKFPPGKVKFTKSSLNDAYIKRMIRELSGDDSNLEKQITFTVADDVEQALQHSNYLTKTIDLNQVESSLFNLMTTHPELCENIPNRTLFDKKYFLKLKNYIRNAYSGDVFPLRSHVDGRMISNPKFVFVDDLDTSYSEKDKTKYKDITTAAATPSGNFIFNVKFMQSLMDFATLKQVKPKFNYYKSRGGPIPDSYCYIDFLIMHEFLHFIADDFYYQHIIPNANNKIINYVGDFRTNYALVKSGYEQLPMGLFHDDINYDRQSNYIDMYNIVSKHLKNESDGTGNNQPDKGNERDKTGGDGIQDRLDRTMNDDHQPGQQEGKKDDRAKRNIDRGQKPIDGDIADRKSLDVDDNNKHIDQKNKKRQSGTGLFNGESEIQKFKFNWEQLLKKMISAVKTEQLSDSYNKPSRKSISQMGTLPVRKTAAVKPGVVINVKEQLRCIIVLDVSGSMMVHLPKVMYAVTQLMSTPTLKKQQILLVKFASNHEIYTLKGKTITQISHLPIKSLNKLPETIKQVTLNTFLIKHNSGGTEFSKTLSNQLTEAVKEGYNVMMFTDRDTSEGNNAVALKQIIMARPKHVFLVLPTASEATEFIKSTHVSTPNITVMKPTE